MARSLKEIYDFCFFAIGGNANRYVNNYLYNRPESITRQSFFEFTVGAIWVSGMKQKSANSFLERAAEAGFSQHDDFHGVANWSIREISNFLKELHGCDVPSRARQKWTAIFDIAKTLEEFHSEDAFRESFFSGKIRSADLDKSDIERLADKRLPFVRAVNAHYIVRRMGGEAIKCDRWIEALLSWYPLTLEQLEVGVAQASIPLGKYDLVIWCYCEQFVQKVSAFIDVFDSNFGTETII